MAYSYLAGRGPSVLYVPNGGTGLENNTNAATPIELKKAQEPHKALVDPHYWHRELLDPVGQFTYRMDFQLLTG